MKSIESLKLRLCQNANHGLSSSLYQDANQGLSSSLCQNANRRLNLRLNLGLNRKLLRFVSLILAIAVIFATSPGVSVSAVVGDDYLVLTSNISHLDYDLSLSGNTLTLTVPYSPSATIVDVENRIVMSSALESGCNLISVAFAGVLDASAISLGAADVNMTMTVGFAYWEGAVSSVTYYTTYDLIIKRAAAKPPSYSGSITESVTLPESGSASISLTLAKLTTGTAAYDGGDYGDISHISIHQTSLAGIGVFKKNGSDYLAGTLITRAELTTGSGLTFVPSSAGKATFTIRAYNDAYAPVAAHVGEATLEITVNSAVGVLSISGNTNKSTVTSGTTVSFIANDFRNRVTPTESASLLTHVRITNVSGSGALNYNGVAPTATTDIALSAINNLKYATSGTGTVTITFIGSFDNGVTYTSGGASGGASGGSGSGGSGSGGGSATISFSVTSSSSSSNYDIDDVIEYYTTTDSYVTFSSSDFYDALRRSTGRTLSYVIFDLPSTSDGRLYYEYRSSSNYDSTVSSSARYYRDSNPRISSVSFVPNGNYSYRTVWIDYTAYDSSGGAYYGEIMIEVDDDYYYNDYYYESNTVAYSTERDSPVSFSAADFSAALSSVTSSNLSYVRFSLPSSTTGILYYDYNPSSSSSTRVSSATNYYRASDPEISNITFVPTSNFTGTVVISFTSYPVSGSSRSGTLYIYVGTSGVGGSTNEVLYSTKTNTPVKLVAADFRDALARRTTMIFSYVMFTQPASSVGKLYYNYRSGSDYDYAITASQRFYQISSPLISSISFAPNSTFTGTAAISYVTYTSSGSYYPGILKITVGDSASTGAGGSSSSTSSSASPSTSSSTSTRNVTYTTRDGEPVWLKPSDINNVIKEISGENFVYLSFNNLPSTLYGVLYYDYFAPDNYDSIVAVSDEFCRTTAPYLSDVAFVPTDGARGAARITYTAYTESDEPFKGAIIVNVTSAGGSGGSAGSGSGGGSGAGSGGGDSSGRDRDKPSSWASAEVNALIDRGVVPTDLQRAYNRMISRAEFTALLVNSYEYLRGEHTPEKTPLFDDISASAYQSSIKKGFSLGIINGHSDTRFGPDESLTREQAAKILCTTAAAIKNIEIHSDFKIAYADNSSISNWATTFVAYATENGLMIGAESNLFKPLDNLTREEAMLLAERLIVKYA